MLTIHPKNTSVNHNKKSRGKNSNIAKMPFGILAILKNDYDGSPSRGSYSNLP